MRLAAKLNLPEAVESLFPFLDAAGIYYDSLVELPNKVFLCHKHLLNAPITRSHAFIIRSFAMKLVKCLTSMIVSLFNL
jgi:hypothetical protein